MIFGGTISIPIENQLVTQGANLDLGSIISVFIPLSLTFGGLFVLIYLIWAGYNWLTAGGDQAKVEAAKSRMTNALIGIAIIASAFAVYSLIDGFFGIGIVDSSGSGGSTIICEGVGTCGGCCSTVTTYCVQHSNGGCIF